jgi:hypothetical protein
VRIRGGIGWMRIRRRIWNQPFTCFQPSTASAQTCSGSTCGSAVIALTDAPGEFLTYMVNVVALQLKRDDGSGSTTITANQIVNGITSLPLDAPNPTQMTLSLSFGNDSELVVTQGAISNLALDFNLPASNAITPSATDPTTVTVNPILTASFVPDATKSLRARGSLVSVNTAANSYIINVRPFHNMNNTVGQVTISTNDGTSWTISGTSYSGAAGLAQLATLPADTMTVAYGTWSAVADRDHRRTAGAVYRFCRTVRMSAARFLCRDPAQLRAYPRGIADSLDAGRRDRAVCDPECNGVVAESGDDAG